MKSRSICQASMAVVAAVAGFTVPAGGRAWAQVPLTSYMDAKGFIDVQALTCAQLANTFQEDADYLAAWYSGWYNGLAKKHLAHLTRAKSGEHELILYCKAHPETKIIKAIAVLLTDRLGREE